MFLKKCVCLFNVFIFYLFFIEYFVRFYWGFRESYDFIVKEFIDGGINLFFNIF